MSTEKGDRNMAENHTPAPPDPGAGFDRHEPRSGLLALVSAAVVALLIVLVVGVYWYYVVAYERIEYEQYTGVESKQLQAIRDREEEHLHRYSYIDKEKGIVRLPIDRAIDLVVSEAQQGKLFHNTNTYPAKPEPPGGAASQTASTNAQAPVNN
jgi:hypothetical protein